MIVLLDENFPLRFYTRLQKEAFPVINASPLAPVREPRASQV
jgi:hypothetical protein